MRDLHRDPYAFVAHRLSRHTTIQSSTHTLSTNKKSLHNQLDWPRGKKCGFFWSVLPHIDNVRAKISMSRFKTNNETMCRPHSGNLVAETNLSVTYRVYHKHLVADSSTHNDWRSGHRLLIGMSHYWRCKQYCCYCNCSIKQRQHDNLLFSLFCLLLRFGIWFSRCQLLWRISHDDCPSFCTRSIIARFSAFE